MQGQRRYCDIIGVPMMMVLVWNMRVPYLYDEKREGLEGCDESLLLYAKCWRIVIQ